MKLATQQKSHRQELTCLVPHGFYSTSLPFLFPLSTHSQTSLNSLLPSHFKPYICPSIFPPLPHSPSTPLILLSPFLILLFSLEPLSLPPPFPFIHPYPLYVPSNFLSLSPLPLSAPFPSLPFLPLCPLSPSQGKCSVHSSSAL